MSQVVLFGSGQPVTCAVMDYSRRLASSVNVRRRGMVEIRTIEPASPAGFVRALADELRRDRIVHLQLPIEGWGNSVIPGSALMAARMLTRRGRIVLTLHEWTLLNWPRYLSIVPDLMATDAFVFVSPHQKESFQRTPWVSARRKLDAQVITIGPNIMPRAVDPAITARERSRLLGEGTSAAELVIGFFGVLYASKRPELLLQTLAALHARGRRARLLVCGDFLWDKPQDREAFFRTASDLGMTDWLDFRGRIDDEGQLLATLAASDVFLLPYSDGLSARRSSFQAVSPLARTLVSTHPERADEFSASALLTAKVFNPATVLRPADAPPEIFADAVLEAHARREAAISVDLSGLWDEAAKSTSRFMTVSEGISGRSADHEPCYRRMRRAAVSVIASASAISTPSRIHGTRPESSARSASAPERR